MRTSGSGHDSLCSLYSLVNWWKRRRHGVTKIEWPRRLGWGRHPFVAGGHVQHQRQVSTLSLHVKTDMIRQEAFNIMYERDADVSSGSFTPLVSILLHTPISPRLM